MIHCGRERWLLTDEIGLDSARATDVSEAQAVWSMAYENLNPEKLRKTHEKMVAEYYG